MTKNIYGNNVPNKNNVSSLFGIFEGKAKAAKAAAAADAAAKIAAAEQQTLLIKTLAAQQGYDPMAAANKAKADENQAKIDELNAAAASEKTLYWILGGVVLVVMVGLYFIKK